MIDKEEEAAIEKGTVRYGIRDLVRSNMRRKVAWFMMNGSAYLMDKRGREAYFKVLELGATEMTKPMKLYDPYDEPKYRIVFWLRDEAKRIEKNIDPSWQSHSDVVEAKARIAYLRQRADEVERDGL